MKTENNKYTQMQKRHYDKVSKDWSIQNRNPVVGSFDKQNKWKEYDIYLFKDIKKVLNKCILLDFGCGVGRCLVKYNSLFKSLDGVDICQTNLDNAKIWLKYNNCKIGNLYKNNGIDLKGIHSNKYDIIMSTICLQHIPVYEIRLNLLKEFYRVLKEGGILTIQMGFGYKEGAHSTYYENNYDAPSTNGTNDVMIESPDELKNDLYKIGFKEFNYYIRPTGIGAFKNWIFFNVKK